MISQSVLSIRVLCYNRYIALSSQKSSLLARVVYLMLLRYKCPDCRWNKSFQEAQICTLVFQKTEENNVHIFDIMGTTNPFCFCCCCFDNCTFLELKQLEGNQRKKYGVMQVPDRRTQSCEKAS